jgi:hypothetical protein
MTPKEIILSNSLIAEFMEVSNALSRYYYLPMFGHYYNSYGNIEYTDTFNEEELKYHSSWDWIMPVVEKIERLCTKERPIDVRIQGGMVGVYVFIPNSTPTEYEYIYQENGYSENDSKIESVWLAMIAFIKWYNQNQKP